MDPLVTALLIWIASQLGCATPEPPHIERVAAQRMAEMLYQGNPPPDATVVALYDKGQRVVYLAEDWRADRITDRSTLLHELVHHAQEAACMAYPCPAAREKLAYHLQAQWLKENGVADPFALMKVDEFTISVHSLCLEPE